MLKYFTRTRKFGKFPASLLLLVLLLIIGRAGIVHAVTVGPDAFGYRAMNANYAFINIAASGSRILAGADDETATLEIGFPFRFYGVNYTNLNISPNGFISFGGAIAEFANVDFSAARPTGNRPMIAVCWSDLTFAPNGSDAVYYQLVGVSPNRQFIIQWNNALALNYPGSMTFQVVLYEGSNNILFQYLSMGSGEGASNVTAGATIGIRDVDGQTNGRVLQWSYKMPVVANESAILFSANTGQPKISGSIEGKGKNAAGVLWIDLKLTNIGTGIARNLQINQLTYKRLSGTGNVTHNSPVLPINAGDIETGSSLTIRLLINCPSTATRFSITENGTVQDVSGTQANFSIAQSVIP